LPFYSSQENWDWTPSRVSTAHTDCENREGYKTIARA
jgi:hypothetical protein